MELAYEGFRAAVAIGQFRAKYATTMMSYQRISCLFGNKMVDSLMFHLLREAEPQNYQKMKVDLKNKAPSSSGNSLSYQHAADTSPNSDKNWWIALLLCWFLGTLGVHRLYVGRFKSGFLMMGGFALFCFGLVQQYPWPVEGPEPSILTAPYLLGCGVWTLVDLFKIIARRFRDSNGLPIK